MDLQGKVALITGASKGIGRATAMAFAKRGAKTALIARSADLLQEVADGVKQLGSEAFVFAGDLCDEKIVNQSVQETINRFGRLDILVNNAGIGHFNPVAELSTANWDAMFDLNVRSLFFSTRASLPYLRDAGESVVVNVVSLAGKNAFKGGGGYAATKHAVLGFSRCLMLEERENGVRVLAICPGSVATHFSQDRKSMDDPRRKRILQPEDVASSIVHMIQLPQTAMISEIDMRPSIP